MSLQMFTTQSYDWESTDNFCLLNPRIPADIQAELKTICQNVELRSHCFLTTSGTDSNRSDSLRLVALSKAAILSSAAAVNTFINASAEDTWIKVLPDFHIGGLSIWARAHLADSKVVSIDTWDLSRFLDVCKSASPSLCSLVPAQVYDLVKAGISSPESLRCVFVGGQELSEGLYGQALELGWKISLTYGMTETASQIASSNVGERELRVLPHLQVKCCEQLLCFRGKALFTGYLGASGLSDPKQDGWFRSGDLGELRESTAGKLISVLGRSSEQVKIGGELVSLTRLDRILDQSCIDCSYDKLTALVALPDERLGHVITIAVEGVNLSEPARVEKLVEVFNARVLPFERIRLIKQVERIPFNELGKLQRKELVGLANRA